MCLDKTTMKMSPGSVLDGLDITQYDDWQTFDHRLGELIRTGDLRRVDPLRILYLRDEEWYLDTAKKDLYVYVRPDDKIFPKWERVDVFANPTPESSRDVRKMGLDIIPADSIDSETIAGLRFVLGVLIDEGKVEIISNDEVLAQAESRIKETFYREVLTDHIYRLIEDPSSKTSRWQRLQGVPATERTQ